LNITAYDLPFKMEDVKCCLVGDPHISKKNIVYTDTMLIDVINIVKDENPHFVEC